MQLQMVHLPRKQHVPCFCISDEKEERVIDDERHGRVESLLHNQDVGSAGRRTALLVYLDDGFVNHVLYEQVA